MPDGRLARTRETLPPGYRFGEAKWTPEQVIAARDVERRTAGAMCPLCGTPLATGQHGIYEYDHYSESITVCRNTMIVHHPRRLGVITGISA